MSKLTKAQWDLLRADFEVNCMSLSELSAKYKMGRSTISERAKRHGWTKGGHEHLIDEKVNAIKMLENYEKKTEQLPNSVRKSIEREAEFKLEMLGIFENSLKYNQVKSTNTLKERVDNGEATLSDFNQHSQITVRHMDRVLGKAPDTAIQINNNEAPTRIERVIVDVNHKD